jgi:hypothetical protein
MTDSQRVTVDVQEFVHLLEPLIRKVVREELAQAFSIRSGVFYLEPGSPLYEDMEEILRRKERGEISLHSHTEVWGE